MSPVQGLERGKQGRCPSIEICPDVRLCCLLKSWALLQINPLACLGLQYVLMRLTCSRSYLTALVQTGGPR